MALIIGQITINGKLIINVAADPSAGAGTPAPTGSLALSNAGGAGSIWVKFGAADTDWITSSQAFWSLLGSTLSGATPDAPDQFIGSTNDYDMVFVRNALTVMRLITDGQEGLVIGTDPHAGTGAAKLELQTLINGGVVMREGFSVGAQGIVANSRLGRVNTAGAVSQFLDIGFQDNNCATAVVTVTARQIGGGTGALFDGASFINNLAIKKVSGVLTILSDNQTFNYSIDPGITVGYSASPGGAVRVTCTGVAGRNLRWGINLRGLNN